MIAHSIRSQSKNHSKLILLFTGFECVIGHIGYKTLTVTHDPDTAQFQKRNDSHAF
jgi:hypothetical protein